MTAYYNEIEPYAADWLRNLIAAGHIAPGDVDERSIEDVHPDDLRGYTQCRFFAGIGVWSYALRLAGWADDRPVWTGSCPCQPFSAAGKGAGFDDERHLWPAWHWLIQECRPRVVFGEQVASKGAEPWLDLVSSDLEALGFAIGAVAFPSASVGATHIRDRTYFLAHTEYGRRQSGQQARRWSGAVVPPSVAGWLADAARSRWREERAHARRSHVGDLAQGLAAGLDVGCGDLLAGPVNGFWAAADWIFCRDGKWRAVEPGTFPLAHGAPARSRDACAPTATRSTRSKRRSSSK